jgi:hypothetical protein
MFNQAFFEKVLVVGVVENPGDVRVEAKLRPPFDVLLGSKLKSFEAEVREAQMTKKSSGKTAKGVIQKADSAFFWSNSFNKTLLVELRGFEPLTPCMPCRCATSCATAPM